MLHSLWFVVREAGDQQHTVRLTLCSCLLCVGVCLRLCVRSCLRLRHLLQLFHLIVIHLHWCMSHHDGISCVATGVCQHNNMNSLT